MCLLMYFFPGEPVVELLSAYYGADLNPYQGISDILF